MPKSKKSKPEIQYSNHSHELLQPDWRSIYRSRRAIEQDLKGFKFKGDGWYQTDTDTLLVLTTDKESIWVYCWSQIGVIAELKRLLDLEVRTNNA